MLSSRTRFALASAAVSLISNLLCAAPALTTIQDVLYKADGTTFNGVLQITWNSFQAGDATEIPKQSVTTQVMNGYLHVLLVPTTNASTPAIYTVVYNSGGQVQFTETWAVPPSTTPLTVADVRTSSTTGSTSGSAAGLSQTPISSVAGLNTELSIRPTMGTGYAPTRAAVIDANGGLNGATGNLSDCIHVDGTSGPCGTSGTGPPPPPAATFTDAESPSGVTDGVNATFQLVGDPSPAPSLAMYRNGLAMHQSVDFTVSGSAITFQTGSVPQPGDVLQAFYRTGSGTTSSAVFADAETPSGTVDGINAAFGLLNSPTPVMSLALFRNGLAMRPNVDFTVSGTAIDFQSGSVPQPGDVLQAFYRASGTSSSTAAFADAETPSGSVDGVNTVFGLANSPSPVASLEVFRNDLALRTSVDFTLSGSTIAFQPSSVPQPGDVLEVFYRTAAAGVAGTASIQSIPSSVPSCTVYSLSNNGTNWTTAVNNGTVVPGPAIASSTLQNVPLFALPSKGTITGIRETTTTAWSGAGFTTLGLSIGDSVGGPAFYTSGPYDLTAAPGNTNFLSTQLFKSATDAGSTVMANISANAFLNAASITGSVDIDVCWVTLP